MPIGAESGVAAVVAVAAQRGGLNVGNRVQPELVAAGWLRHGAGEGDGLTIWVPAQILNTTRTIGSYYGFGTRATLGAQVGEEEGAAHIGVRDVAAIG